MQETAETLIDDSHIQLERKRQDEDARGARTEMDENILKEGAGNLRSFQVQVMWPAPLISPARFPRHTNQRPGNECSMVTSGNK